MAKRILILSFYYPPDLSAGSFRTSALVAALRELRSPGVTFEVITTLPNRYSTFDSKAPEEEADGPVSICRIKLPRHRSGMLDQAIAFRHFSRAAKRLSRRGTYDLVFATSSRLMTAALGAQIARELNVPLYLDIRDIFADTIKDVLPMKLGFIFEPIISMIERRTIQAARHVNLVSQGFGAYFLRRYPRQEYSFYTNGVDEEFILSADAFERMATRIHPGPIKVVYAGNIGEGQGLHSIIPALARHLRGRVVFKVIGDGGRKPQLEAALRAADLTDVALAPPVSRAALLQEYLAADILFLHLNDHRAFEKVLPSKIFEYAALGKPIWAGVPGHAATFLRSEVSNVAVFSPCNVVEALAAFERLQISTSMREEFVRKYSRKRIMRLMAQNIMSVIQEGGAL